MAGMTSDTGRTASFRGLNGPTSSDRRRARDGELGASVLAARGRRTCAALSDRRGPGRPLPAVGGGTGL